MIAEEVYTVRPDIVTRDKDGMIDAIQYQYIEPMVLNELIKLKQIVDELVAKVAILEAK